MAKMIQVPYHYEVSLPVEVAQSVQANKENPISLEALGLLVNLISYPSNWELHKTELYKRYAKNKETSVTNAWRDLINARYIVEYKYRSGKKWEYVYYFRKVPFSPEEIDIILDTAEKEHGEVWGLDFPDLKMKTSKSSGNQSTLLNKNPILNNYKDYINYIDDDKRAFAHQEEKIDLIISTLREATKDELSERSFKSVVKKVVDKYIQGKVNSFRDYLVTALIGKIEELDIRRQKEKGMEQAKKLRDHSRLKKLEPSEDIPIYNWLA